MAKVKKLFRQNMIDFLINNYGDLNNMAEFIKTNNIVSMEDYNSRTTLEVDNVIPNDTLDVFTLENTKVVTGNPEYVPSDFNNDFNEDFLI